MMGPRGRLVAPEEDDDGRGDFEETWGRRMRLFWCAARVMCGYKLTRKRDQWMKPAGQGPNDSTPEQDRMWEAAHRKYSKLILNTITKERGFWVKTGQYMSSRADVLPKPYIEELARLQDALPPHPMKEILQTLEEELAASGRTVADTFERIDPEPLGAASIAQVHRAWVKGTGEEVVVKVQHRGIARQLKQDLRTLMDIMRAVAYFEPQFDFRVLMEEWNKEVSKEVDFENEAKNTIDVANEYALSVAQAASRQGALEEVGFDPLPPIVARIPRVVDSLVSRRLLTMHFVDGVKVNDVRRLEEWGVDKEKLVRHVFEAYAHQIHIGGLVNADPHPGNILVVRDAEHGAVPVLLDFGLAKRLAPKVRVAFARLVYSVATVDYAGLLRAFDELGFVLNPADPASKDPSVAMRIMRFWMRRSATRDEEVAEIRKYKAERDEIIEKDPAVKRMPVDAFPAELIFVFRVFQLLRGLSTALGVRSSYIYAFAPYAKRALLETVPPEARAKTIVWPSPSPGPLDAKVRALLEELYKTKKVTGIQVYAWKDGRTVVDCCAGTLSDVDLRPVRPDTLFNCWSVTKSVTALAAHILLDEGLLDATRLVTDYWPTFAGPSPAHAPKRRTRVFHLLTHTAGLANAMPEDLSHERLVDWPAMLRCMEEATPEHEPGESAAYHYLTFGWLVGGLVEKALALAKRGTSFRDFVRTRIAEPLGVAGEFHIGIPPGPRSARRAS
eukprot:tig00001428_g8723.t1